jgi:integrase
MKGHIRRRGERSWELKFDAGHGADGKRAVRYHSFKGTKREAQQRLAELIASVGQGAYVAPAKMAVGEFVAARVGQWEAAGDITARTAQRYRQLLNNQIVPHLGGKALQALTRLDVEGWHTALRATGIAARTIGHAHRVLGKALGDAERDGRVAKNVCRLLRAPRVAEVEMRIVQDVPAFVGKIAGARLEVPAILALFTGMRLGEILALRDGRVDLDKGVVEVREALEETKANGVVFKTPKSKAGRRNITLPDIVVDALREHRKAALELRMRLGLGRIGPDDLLFPRVEGGPLRPNAVSWDWGKFAEQIGMGEITFHSLRHTHASQLIAAGVDIVTISKRLGHARPNVTLAIYAHMFSTDDSKAAAAINAALRP